MHCNIFHLGKKSDCCLRNINVEEVFKDQSPTCESGPDNPWQLPE